jgi:hypothetical protein
MFSHSPDRVGEKQFPSVSGEYGVQITTGPRRNLPPAAVFVGKCSDVNLKGSRLVRKISQPPPVGREGAASLVIRCLQEEFRFTGPQSLPVDLNRDGPEVESRSRGYFVKQKPFAVGCERARELRGKLAAMKQLSLRIAT